MKFLSVPALENVTTTLQTLDLGDRLITGCVESYSCKRTGDDKKLYLNVVKRMQEEIARRKKGSQNPSDKDSTGTEVSTAIMETPLGNMTEPATRKVLAMFISALNSSFPDYDFSEIMPDMFERISSYRAVYGAVDDIVMRDIEHQRNGFRAELWNAINNAINVSKCDIYSFVPDPDSRLFSIGKLWSFNYFFYNKDAKRTVLFTCFARSKLNSPTVGGVRGRMTIAGGFLDEDEEEEEEEEESEEEESSQECREDVDDEDEHNDESWNSYGARKKRKHAKTKEVGVRSSHSKQLATSSSAALSTGSSSSILISSSSSSLDDEDDESDFLEDDDGSDDDFNHGNLVDVNVIAWDDLGALFLPDSNWSTPAVPSLAASEPNDVGGGGGVGPGGASRHMSISRASSGDHSPYSPFSIAAPPMNFDEQAFALGPGHGRTSPKMKPAEGGQIIFLSSVLPSSVAVAPSSTSTLSYAASSSSSSAGATYVLPEKSPVRHMSTDSTNSASSTCSKTCRAAKRRREALVHTQQETKPG